jgi:hypothetical protein
MSPSGYTPATDIKTILKSSDMVVKFDGLVTQTSVAQSSTNIGTCIVTVEASTVA